jgi:hypothetical protein
MYEGGWYVCYTVVETNLIINHHVYANKIVLVLYLHLILNNNNSVPDPYRATGTIYLHGKKNGNDSSDVGNPTGAVVYPISLATTFKQAAPGLPTAPEDPNSFGLGYEYSRTGKSIYLLIPPMTVGEDYL